jgi:hypothetical protein
MLLFTKLLFFHLGQIASLTGGESGNESPLAVEMYVLSICHHFQEIVYLRSIIQWTICHNRVLHCYPFRYRFLCCGYHHRIQRKGGTNRHICCFDPCGLGTGGSSFSRYSAFVDCGEANGGTECPCQGFARCRNFRSDFIRISLNF